MTLLDRHRTTKTDSGQDYICPHYRSRPGEKRCQDYIKGGLCARDDSFQCVEWLRANNRLIPRNHPVLAEHSQDLFGAPIPAQGVSAEPPVPAPAPAETAPVPQKPPEPPQQEEAPPVRGPISEEEIASFKALGVEVAIHSEEFGEVWLVPEYTEKDRREVSVEHAATLRLLLDSFPGSRVRAFDQISENRNKNKDIRQ